MRDSCRRALSGLAVGWRVAQRRGMEDMCGRRTQTPQKRMIKWNFCGEITRNIEKKTLKCAFLSDGVTRGLVVGAYECAVPGEYKLTPTGCRVDFEAGERISAFLKRCDLSKTRAVVLADTRPDLHALAVAGLGPEDAACSDAECRDEAKENVRVAAGVGAKALQDFDVEDILVESFGCAAAAAEGALLSTWCFEELKDCEIRKPEVNVDMFDPADDNTGWCWGTDMANAQNFTRRLEETPANILKPSHFSQVVLEELCPLNVHVEVRDTGWLEEQRMCGLLAVARGSCEPPFLLEMSYCGGGENDRPVILVGKGVTFDSGGVSLKAQKAMVEDGVLGMAGGAVVAGVMKGLATLKVPINVYGLVPLLENMPGGLAARPGDVILSQSGRTVLLDTTEHEGEVVLADVLSFSAGFGPCMVLSIAALCNELRKTLGAPASGAFCSSNSLWMELIRAAADTGDRVWRLPLWRAYWECITRNKSVDMSNLSYSPGGDPCASAAFLKEFAPCCDFLHLDISGTGGTPTDDSTPYLEVGLRTGRPTRTVIQLLYQFACPVRDQSSL